MKLRSSCAASVVRIASRTRSWTTASDPTGSGFSRLAFDFTVTPHELQSEEEVPGTQADGQPQDVGAREQQRAGGAQEREQARARELRGGPRGRGHLRRAVAGEPADRQQATGPGPDDPGRDHAP